ncbi:hypothetical protein BVC80_9063g89 [Macleaya cordata]|uniref:Plant thionin family protein n=1 Tax=Macleaya cordata TaxID=56857 RepID=A0A200PND7_MACCD|nr:hypothetical protein BVC80_9063g89 [Macleaya cordata]
MEGKSVRERMNVVMVIVVLLMGMFIGQSSASFKKCYDKCMYQCNIEHWGPDVLICPAKCTAKCIFKEAPSNDLHRYCTMGCTSSARTNFSGTPQDPLILSL